MNGAKALLNTLLKADIDVCFTNPGTSEMHFVAALDSAPEMRCVLGLFEGVVTGAADGYARMAGKPAATLLHLGPGLGNGLANLHNARRSNSPVVNIIGDHAKYHQQYDAPLSSDINAIAGAVSGWVRSSSSADNVARDTADAITAASTAPGRVASLILPADVSWSETAHQQAELRSLPAPDKVSDDAIAHIADKLSGGEPAMILLGGTIGLDRMQAAANIAEATGARISLETFPDRTVHGAGTPVVERVAYLSEWAIEVLKEVKHVILVGAREPIGFFAYPDVESRLLAADCQVHQLASLEQDIDDALTRLGNITGSKQAPVHQRVEAELPTGVLDSNSIAQSLAQQLPRDSIVVDEGIVGGISIFPATDTAEPHEWIMLGGGAIGWGLPAATGAAIACPDRKVVCLEGDGSGMYTIQALWTMAREKLDVTTIIFANRQYAILQIEFSRVGADGMGENAQRQLNIGNPDINYTELATSMGVNATRVTTSEEFNDAFARCMAEPGPHLIEAVI